ncbi:(3S,6E)-nerolidol synthase 1-like isoform X1 [Olea europaea subsp. europaea]|uniref:(3S,6E)-nerolidol synthase 1-like isoform X1 n=1 Tax=Olea europaea subsp. europaea TaxID=158383 RepID=A0A8S0RE10_OLEEU|nr:(3S,6E)-nerolidol synthase 1-like isoform X1 [Olea europaea subsp. europaea]
MELYEAAQLVTGGEDILDEAAKFSGQIKSIRDFQGINGWRKTLKELAKMNISMAQTANPQELDKISKWWKDLGLAQELKKARNQPLKWYTWSMASLSDPSMSEQRLELTKSITFIYLIDVIFDLYGTPEELTVFTRAVHMYKTFSFLILEGRAIVDMLPKPVKMCYKVLLDTTNDIGYKIYKKHGYNPIDSIKSAWGSLCDAFLVEVKWFASGHLPTSHEYLENGKINPLWPLFSVSGMTLEVPSAPSLKNSANDEKFHSS